MEESKKAGEIWLLRWQRGAVRQVGGVNCSNAFVAFKDRKSVELAKERLQVEMSVV